MVQFKILRHCGACCTKITSGNGKSRQEANAADQGWLILCYKRCPPVRWSVFSSISGLYPVDAYSGLPLTFQVVTTQNVCRHFQMSPGVVESSPTESHCCRTRGKRWRLGMMWWQQSYRDVLRFGTRSGRRGFTDYVGRWAERRGPSLSFIARFLGKKIPSHFFKTWKCTRPYPCFFSNLRSFQYCVCFMFSR